MIRRNKTFLSDSHEEFGSVSWVVETNGEDNILGYVVEANLTISDCSKCAQLDFDCKGYKHIDKRIKKLDTLIEELQKMKEAMLEVKASKRKKFYY